MLTTSSGLYRVFSTESVINLLHCTFCKKPFKDVRFLIKVFILFSIKIMSVISLGF